MQAGDVKLGSIFFDNHRYEIPMFQRPYVWSRERNWAPLWEDVAGAADGVVSDMESGEWLDEPPTYFLGAIVVKATPAHPQRLAGSILVDGQQRLTTLQVMLAAARSVAHELGAESAAGRFDEWIWNSPKAVHERHPDDRYKLWPLPQDRPQYLWAVRGPEDTSPCPDDGHRISQARVWFEDSVRTWATRDGDPRDRLDALHSALETRMELVRITLEKTDNAQVIFEALNHRGVELSQSDLIKNLLFRLVEEQGQRHRAESLLVDHWLPLDNRTWRAETISGRIRRSLLDQVVAYWLTVRTGEVVSVERLFDDFKQWLVEGRFDAGDVIQEIRTHADLYEMLVSDPPDESIAALVDLVIATKTNTVWPLILGIYGDPRITSQQRRRAADALRSYLTRRMICGLTSKDYNRNFVSVLKLALTRAEADGLAGDAVEQALAQYSGESRGWPEDGEFMAAVFGTNFYALAKPRVRVFFAGIENHLRDGRAEAVERIRASWEHLNIEHVMPQNWQQHWPLHAVPDGEPDEDPTGLGTLVAQRERAINSVGNLTLTNGRLNAQMSNGAWPDKRPALQQKSTLLITTASILAAPPGVSHETGGDWAAQWEEDRIAKRSLYLTSIAVKVWPRPNIEPVGDAADDVGESVMSGADTQSLAATHSGGRRPSGAIAAHIRQSFAGRPLGLEMSLDEIRAMASNEYASGEVSAGALAAALHAARVPGFEWVSSASPRRVRRMPSSTERIATQTPADDPAGDPIAVTGESIEAAVDADTLPTEAQVEREFHRAMIATYRRTQVEVHYNPSLFIRMISDLGGLETARRLVRSSTPSDGFRVLWEAGRLDLTAEAQILRPEFSDLFSDELREQARQRLDAHDYRDDSGVPS